MSPLLFHFSHHHHTLHTSNKNHQKVFPGFPYYFFINFFPHVLACVSCLFIDYDMTIELYTKEKNVCFPLRRDEVGIFYVNIERQKSVVKAKNIFTSYLSYVYLLGVLCVCVFAEYIKVHRFHVQR